jgi:hypothetical protein
MGDNNWIQRLTLGSDTASVGLQNANRCVIRVTQDTRIAYDAGLVDSVYFTIPAGTIIVLDPPLFIDVLWIKLDSAASGVIEFWATGCGHSDY